MGDEHEWHHALSLLGDKWHVAVQPERERPELFCLELGRRHEHDGRGLPLRGNVGDGDGGTLNGDSRDDHRGQ